MEPEGHSLPGLDLVSHAITHAANGFHVGSLVTQLFAQPSDVRIKSPRSRVAVIAPHSVHQRLAREHVSPASHQLLEQIEFLGGEGHRAISGDDVAALRKEPDSTDLNYVRPVFTTDAAK